MGINWTRRAAYSEDSRSQPLSYEGVTGTEEKMKKKNIEHVFSSYFFGKVLEFHKFCTLVHNQRKQHSERASSYHA